MFPVGFLCRVMGVSRSGFYAFQSGGTHRTSDLEVGLLVGKRFWENLRRYGSRRIVAQLKKEGHVLGRHKVRKIMRQYGLKAIQPSRCCARSRFFHSQDGTEPQYNPAQPIPCGSH